MVPPAPPSSQVVCAKAWLCVQHELTQQLDRLWCMPAKPGQVVCAILAFVLLSLHVCGGQVCMDAGVCWGVWELLWPCSGSVLPMSVTPEVAGLGSHSQVCKYRVHPF